MNSLKNIDKKYKRNLAVRELNRQGIFEINSIPLVLTEFKTIVEYYEKFFNKKLQLKSRYTRRTLISGKIYVIGNLTEMLCKIGYSNNPNKRLKEVQTGCPYRLEILATFDGNIPTEKQLHEKYKEYNINGEWFRIEGNLKIALEKFLNN